MTTQSYSTAVTLTPEYGGILGRCLGMLYALAAYALGASALFWLFFAAGGFAPYGISAYRAEGLAAALLVNFGLVLLFAVQHTVMARKGFKARLCRVIPPPLERATFVLCAGLATLLLIWFWQPLPGEVWQVSDPLARGLIHAGWGAGVIYVLWSSLLTNHFELFGLRQAWLHLRGRPHTPVQFSRRSLYGFSRHPMMLGILMVLWLTPEMTLTRLSLGLLLTVYLFAGIRFEEHGLVQEFGERYREYQRNVGMFYSQGRRH